MSELPNRRGLVLARLLTARIDRKEAMFLLGLSDRSIRRLQARLLAGGPDALVHRNTGQRPAHALEPEVAARVVGFARDGYAGLNDTHLSELLAEREGVLVSRASVQRILRGAGIASPRTRRAPRFRSRRARRAAGGMLVQLDGSPHRWFGAARPAVSLLGAIDDATSSVCGAVFREQEDAAGYLAVMAQVIHERGVPLAAYSDHHSVFWIARKEGQTLEDEQGRERMPTQLGRAFRRARGRDDPRRIAPGQGPHRAALEHLPGPPGRGAAPRGHHHPRRGECVPAPVKVMSEVWQLDLPHEQQALLLALADHAHDDGSKCFPGVDYLAWKTGYDRRSVQRILRSLEARRLIMPVAHVTGGRGHSTEYLLDIAKGDKKSPFVAQERAAPSVLDQKLVI